MSKTRRKAPARPATAAAQAMPARQLHAAEAAAKVPRRPRGDVRREVFVRVATEEFLTSGFGNTTLGAIVSKAGGSLATLYAQFGSKEALFEAIMESHSERILAPLTTRPGKDSQPIEKVLENLGRSLMGALLQPETLATYRLVVAEGSKFETVRNAFLDRGLGRGEQLLTALLRERAEAEGLRIDDPLLAAQRLVALLQARFWTRAVCGVPMQISSAHLRRHVEEAVAFFLAGCRHTVEPSDTGKTR